MPLKSITGLVVVQRLRQSKLLDLWRWNTLLGNFDRYCW